MFPSPEPAARTLERRYRTLIRGVEFLAREGRAGSQVGITADNLLTDRVRARLLGNHLRELDRFLSVLADDAALHLAPPGHDARAFARLTNTANKLRAVRGMMGLDCPDHERLRAIRQISDCAHHCGGRVHAPAAWRRPMFAVAVRRGMLVVPRTVLDQICQLYGRVAADLLVQLGRRRPLSIDLARYSGHIGIANVACDGN